jgi:hypothetical protein
VKTVRKPIARPSPDAKPPKDFREAGGRRKGAEAKQEYMEMLADEPVVPGGLRARVEGSPYYMDFLKSIHPKIEFYKRKKQLEAYNRLAYAHPRLRAELAKVRNELYAIPNYPTSSRVMKPEEQKFLAAAMQRIHEDVEEKPFHMHGELGAVGTKSGEITEFEHNPGGTVALEVGEGDKYALHSHPPFVEPFVFSASEPDHMVATGSYLESGNKAKEYITNGKDVLQIQPDSLELVKLVPDPEVEKVSGEFPEAFRLPDPRHPPRPFSNHEAPAAFRKGWLPPAGWKRPWDYPRKKPISNPGVRISESPPRTRPS